MHVLTALIVILSFATAACGLFFPQRVYIIPDGVEGDVFIFHSVARGEKVERSGNSVTFNIPDSRFLITQYTPGNSAFMASYYYAKSDGTKLLLDVEHSSLHRTEENLGNTRPFIWFPRDGGSAWSKVPCEVKYEQFYVGTRPHMLAITQKERDDDHFRFQAFVEANADRLCEGKPKVQTTFSKKETTKPRE